MIYKKTANYKLSTIPEHQGKQVRRQYSALPC